MEVLKKVDKYFLKVQSILGHGTYATVYEGYEDGKQNIPLAIKSIPRNHLSTPESNQMFLEKVEREYSILKKIKSPFVVQLKGARQTSHSIYFILELCNEGNLEGYLEKHGGKLPESQATTFTKNVIAGYKELFIQKIIHRDLKPANILIHNGIAKISDFGFSRFSNDKKPSMMTTLGSPGYMAPEVIEQREYDSKCDVWSLGVIYFEMLTGRHPFFATNTRINMELLLSGDVDWDLLSSFRPQVSQFIQKMLVPPLEKRISWLKILDEWVKNL